MDFLIVSIGSKFLPSMEQLARRNVVSYSLDEQCQLARRINIAGDNGDNSNCQQAERPLEKVFDYGRGFHLVDERHAKYLRRNVICASRAVLPGDFDSQCPGKGLANTIVRADLHYTANAPTSSSFGSRGRGAE